MSISQHRVNWLTLLLVCLILLESSAYCSAQAIRDEEAGEVDMDRDEVAAAFQNDGGEARDLDYTTNPTDENLSASKN